MDSKDDIINAFEEFNQKQADKIPDILERYFSKVALTGEPLFEWDTIKPAFSCKMNQSMRDFNEQVPTDHFLPTPNVENVKFEEMRVRLMQVLDTFSGAPFTIQRLCEMITNPLNHYKRTDKFMRGIEKNMMIVSSVDPFGNKIVCDPKNRQFINGIEANGAGSAGLNTPEKKESPFLPPPPTNSPAVSSWFSSVTPANSPAAIMSPWLRSGGGDAEDSGMSPVFNEAWADRDIDDYVQGPPEKRTRLSHPDHEVAPSGSQMEAGPSSLSYFSRRTIDNNRSVTMEHHPVMAASRISPSATVSPSSGKGTVSKDIPRETPGSITGSPVLATVTSSEAIRTSEAFRSSKAFRSSEAVPSSDRILTSEDPVLCSSQSVDHLESEQAMISTPCTDPTNKADIVKMDSSQSEAKPEQPSSSDSDHHKPVSNVLGEIPVSQSQASQSEGPIATSDPETGLVSSRTSIPSESQVSQSEEHLTTKQCVDQCVESNRSLDNEASSKDAVMDTSEAGLAQDITEEGSRSVEDPEASRLSTVTAGEIQEVSSVLTTEKKSSVTEHEASNECRKQLEPVEQSEEIEQSRQVKQSTSAEQSQQIDQSGAVSQGESVEQSECVTEDEIIEPSGQEVMTDTTRDDLRDSRDSQGFDVCSDLDSPPCDSPPSQSTDLTSDTPTSQSTERTNDFPTAPPNDSELEKVDRQSPGEEVEPEVSSSSESQSTGVPSHLESGSVESSKTSSVVVISEVHSSDSIQELSKSCDESIEALSEVHSSVSIPVSESSADGQATDDQVGTTSDCVDGEDTPDVVADETDVVSMSTGGEVALGSADGEARQSEVVSSAAESSEPCESLATGPEPGPVCQTEGTQDSQLSSSSDSSLGNSDDHEPMETN